ncbi:hypothetical protein DIURU_004737 [Diutina rugosa]|uniref:Glutathione hydrolase n=1 Tax=Diutina rugosa TaxID=5481 RepID=A0A642UF25_DIURU|nr:uncharacterized protein DIURU_004737 [Diutina rugosa]KAA8897884.1 hypothetical protein DIURU_004737 [Diutina rugosa]
MTKPAPSRRPWRLRFLYFAVWLVALVTLASYRYRLATGPAPAVPLDPIRELDPYQALSLHLESDPLRDGLGKPTINPDPKHVARGRQAMVACDVPLCSTMGKDILRQGGNAADAAITVALCIGSVNSHSSGIGGGGFILSKNGDDVISIDAREAAPKAASKHMYDEFPLYSIIGGRAVAVPGELKGLWNLYQHHSSGNLTWKQLFEPVIKLNREGWPCSVLFELILQVENEQVFSLAPQLKEGWDFIFRDDGSMLHRDDWIKRPNYADTLEKIAESGSADIFYDPDGELVKGMVASAKRSGGLIVAQDFANYDVVVEKPISTVINFPQGSKTVYTARGVSSGLAMIAGLKFFTRVFKNDGPSLYLHKLIESFKWLAAIRTRFGDTEDVYKEKLIKNYTSDAWIDSVFAENKYSDDHTFDWSSYGPEYEMASSMGTAHFSVVDKHNNSVAMTTTVNLLFGSLVYDNRTGIILNNEMDDFSMPQRPNSFNLTPSVHNFIRPHKRPLSSTSPTIIVDKHGRPEMVIGCAGGSRIPTAVLQAIIGVYFYNYTMLEAIAYPRLHHQLIPEAVMVENRTVLNELYPKAEAALRKRNHTILESGTLSAMNGIRWSEEDQQYHGVSDFWRKMGRADGY